MSGRAPPWDVQQVEKWRGHFEPGAWGSLTGSLRRLDPSFPLDSIPDLEFGFLPGAPGREVEACYERLCRFIRGAGGPATAAPAPARDARDRERRPDAGPSDRDRAPPVGRQRKKSRQLLALENTFNEYTDTDARNAVRGAIRGANTASTYDSAVQHIRVTQNGPVKEVILQVTALKGSTRIVDRPVSLEELPGAPHLSFAWTPIRGPILTKIRLCPVAIMSAIRDIDAGEALGNLALKSPYGRARRVLEGEGGKHPGLLHKAGLLTGDHPAKGITWHSGRVGGACALLRAGLRKEVVQSRGFWESPSMPDHYARQMILNPSAVPAWAFACPVSLAHMYDRPGGQPEQTAPP
eukprot:TRINITY_DN3571_c0_g1_i4.p1 TRINITY_DN3571_c0_g1~~TRINITY_DN3571_c0_g1_i4.p1  ORF type:complete len:352 (+),score=10.21 TRINITY_DN3571_c0_g1_i4:770-1825(+)